VYQQLAENRDQCLGPCSWSLSGTVLWDRFWGLGRDPRPEYFVLASRV